LLEKNDRLGLKIHISGGGKCNITHGGDMESLRRAFEPDEARFLRLAFRRFTNDDVLDLLRVRGVPGHTRQDGRVFPDSGRREAGHTVAPLRAALAPSYLDGGCRPEYSGVALRDCVLRARLAGKEIARWRGDLLFTHQGISGPTALGVSRAVARGMEDGEVRL